MWERRYTERKVFSGPIRGNSGQEVSLIAESGGEKLKRDNPSPGTQKKEKKM